MNPRTQFWNQLLVRCDAIAAIDPGADDARAQLSAQLETIATAYGQHFDPADQFEEYVAMALCRTIEQVVSRMK